MRIKRFNENQQYLTDPFDPEKKLEFILDFNDIVNNLEKDFKLLADVLGLEFKMKRHQGDNIPEYFFTKDDLTKQYCWGEETYPLSMGIVLTGINDAADIKTFEDLKQNLIEYFEL